MKKVITSFLMVFACIACYSQTLPHEDYINSKSSVAFFMHKGGSYGQFGASELYYNDSIVIVSAKGLIKSPFYFKIFKKRYDKSERTIYISCYSDELLRQYKDTIEIKKKTPSFVVQLFNTSMNGIKFTNVSCLFYWNEVRLGFGTDANSRPKLLPEFKKRHKTFFKNHSPATI